MDFISGAFCLCCLVAQECVLPILANLVIYYILKEESGIGKTLQDFWEKYPLAEQPLTAWYMEAIHSAWNNPNGIKEKYGSADILPGNRVVFNIGGNKYRLIVKIAYKMQLVFIRFVGTHSEYEKINAETI